MRDAIRLAHVLRAVSQREADTALQFVANELGEVIDTGPVRIQLFSNGITLAEDDLYPNRSVPWDALVRGDTVLVCAVGNEFVMVAVVKEGTQPVLTYSRSTETPAVAQIRDALVDLGLVEDDTTA